MKIVNMFILYSLSFVLLMEWLLPLPYVTDTGYIFLFIMETFIFFILNFLQIRPLISVTCQLFVILYGLHYMFFEGSIFQFEWFFYFVNDTFVNIIYLFTGQILHLTDLFRSFLFFILLAMMSYLLYHWIVRVKRIFLFLLFTIVFVTVIDTFTAYDATFAIIRIFVIGFLLLGFVRMMRTMEESRVTVHSKWLFFRLLLSLSSIIIIASLFGISGPKFEPQWDDPVPFLISAAGLDDAIVQQKIGYGENDERLGGGFALDDTPIFYANVEKAAYYRGETKNYYSGKGWLVSTPEDWEPIPVSIFEHQVEKVERKAEIYLTGNQSFSHIFYPGEVTNVKTTTDIPLTVMLDLYTLKGTPFFDNRRVLLEEYVLTYDDPQFSVETLRQATSNDPDWIEQYYLQLPEQLPERIQQLTEEIIANYDNRYDQVKAVERYLSGKDFQYETKNVPIPNDDEDYVDQFLFETRRGYCDNFSTAMAVMLRTVDIPTRWVKGFTEGERITTVDGISQYLITSENAHSWVEVYFPEHGWVPFEPTKGFHYGNAFTFDQTSSNDIDWEDEHVQNKEEKEKEQTEQKEEKEAKNNRLTTKSNVNLAMMFGIIASIVVIVLLIWKVRKIKWPFTIKTKQEAHTFEEKYEQLLQLLEKTGLTRLQGETLREYARRIDNLLATDIMTKLTEKYEQYSYGRVKEFVLTEEDNKLFTKMENKIRS